MKMPRFNFVINSTPRVLICKDDIACAEDALSTGNPVLGLLLNFFKMRLTFCFFLVLGFVACQNNSTSAPATPEQPSASSLVAMNLQQIAGDSKFVQMQIDSLHRELKSMDAAAKSLNKEDQHTYASVREKAGTVIGDAYSLSEQAKIVLDNYLTGKMSQEEARKQADALNVTLQGFRKDLDSYQGMLNSLKESLSPAK